MRQRRRRTTHRCGRFARIERRNDARCHALRRCVCCDLHGAEDRTVSATLPPNASMRRAAPRRDLHRSAAIERFDDADHEIGPLAHQCGGVEQVIRNERIGCRHDQSMSLLFRRKPVCRHVRACACARASHRVTFELDDSAPDRQNHRRKPADGASVTSATRSPSRNSRVPSRCDSGVLARSRDQCTRAIAINRLDLPVSAPFASAARAGRSAGTTGSFHVPRCWSATLA